MIRYFEIGWNSKQDGPGHRVVIYLQGCHLRCPWCHSPHSWDRENAPLLFQQALCTNCGMCVDVCKQGVHKIQNGIHTVERTHCIKCGACQAVCPHSQPDSLGGALSLPTREKEPLELFRLVQPQLEMFRKNGGVTLSGGEALLQAEEVKEFLILCKQNGISTCIESSFTLPEEKYRMVLDYADYWLAGLRDTGFGKGSQINDENLIKKIKLVSQSAKGITARYPLIGGYTTLPEHLKRYVEIMTRTGLQEIELLRCNPGMLHYYDLTGKTCELSVEDVLTTREQWQYAVSYFKEKGIHVKNELFI